MESGEVRHDVVDGAYKDGSGSEHGIYQANKLALCLYALQKLSNTYCYGDEENLFRSQGPDGGFHIGYDQAGTYAGTMENAETSSIAMILFSSFNSTCPLPFYCVPPIFSIPPSIIYLYAGLAATAAAVVITIIVLDQRKPNRMPKIAPNSSP
jgi:hypothetical protein